MFVLPLISLLTSSLVIVDALPSLRTYLDTSSRQLKRRDDPSIQATGPLDHSWIETFASVGDSFAAGLGAGHYISATKGLELNGDCYQYSFGYSNLLNANDMIGVNPRRVFQYLGCSGALTPGIRDKQVPKMRNSQLITLSAGGNDAHFATILNYCVYQWSTWFFWSCEGEVKKASDTIDSKEYNDDMTSMIQAVAKKLHDSTGRIYWIAYTRPFDTTTKDCDSVTWGMAWKARKQYLTQDRRTLMNDLTDKVNEKIKSACQATGQCVYVDPNADIDTMRGHYCEPGVDETWDSSDGGHAANREETWPYEWGTTKDDDTDDEKEIDQPQKHKRNDIPGPVDNTTFEGAIANYIADGVAHSTIDPTILQSFNGDGFTAQGSLLPDKYGRVFHMNKWANGVIAANILKAMDAEQAKIMNQPVATTTLSVCTNLAIASATSPAAAAATTCVGNQIQGSCVQAHLPSSTPNSGPLAPACNKVDSTEKDSYVRINDQKASDAASTYCDNLISAGTVLDSSSTAPAPGTQDDAAENGGSLSLAVLFDAAACDPGTADADQKIDFKALGRDACYQNLYTSISQYCSQDSTWGDYDADYTLEGGVVGLSCGLWSLSGEPAS